MNGELVSLVSYAPPEFYCDPRVPAGAPAVAAPVDTTPQMARALGERRPQVSEVRFASPLEHHKQSPLDNTRRVLVPQPAPRKSILSATITQPVRAAEKPTEKASPVEQSSTLSRSLKVRADRPALKPKTIVFGKTVNVSQTVEGTSRLEKQKQGGLEKKMMQINMMESVKQQRQAHVGGEGKENAAPPVPRDYCSDDDKALETANAVVREVGASLDLFRKEMADLKTQWATDKEKDAVKDRERDEQMKKMMEIITDLVRKDSMDERGEGRQRAGRDGHSEEERKKSRPTVREVSPEVGRAREQIDDDMPRRIEHRHLPALNRRMTVDPLFRQSVWDALAYDREERDVGMSGLESLAEDQFSPPHMDGRRREQRDWMDPTPERPRNHHSPVGDRDRERNRDKEREHDRPPVMTQRVTHTFERQFRCPPSMAGYSVDTRNFIMENNLISGLGEDAAAESLYRPGESYSYYPPDRNRDRYTVEEPMDELRGASGAPRREIRERVQERMQRRKERAAADQPF